MKKGYSILLLLLIFLTLIGCFNTPTGDTWDFIGLEGKNINHLVLSNPYLYACAGPDGLWKKNINESSSDWQYLGMADSSLAGEDFRGVIDVVVNPENTDEILIAFDPINTQGHSVYKSVDGGENWASADSGLEIYDSGYKMYTPMHAIVYYPNYVLGAGDGVFKTETFGSIWSDASNTQDVWAMGAILECNNHAVNNVWLGGYNVFYNPVLASSADGGITWRKYNSVDFGLSTLYYASVKSIAFHPQDTNTVYVGFGDVIIKTTDGGNSWVVPCDSGVVSQALLSDPENEDHLWAAGVMTFTETFDAGVSWQEIDNPIQSNILNMLLDEVTQFLYFGTRSGVYCYIPYEIHQNPHKQKPKHLSEKYGHHLGAVLPETRLDTGYFRDLKSLGI